MAIRTPTIPIALAATIAASTAFSQVADDPAGAVLDRHLAAFAAHDLDALMADYTENSVMVTPQAVLHGPAEIRPLFAGLVEEFSAPEAVLDLRARHVDGAVAYVLWSAETPETVYRFATDTPSRGRRPHPLSDLRRRHRGQGLKPEQGGRHDTHG